MTCFILINTLRTWQKNKNRLVVKSDEAHSNSSSSSFNNKNNIPRDAIEYWNTSCGTNNECERKWEWDGKKRREKKNHAITINLRERKKNIRRKQHDAWHRNRWKKTILFWLQLSDFFFVFFFSCSLRRYRSFLFVSLLIFQCVHSKWQQLLYWYTMK